MRVRQTDLQLILGNRQAEGRTEPTHQTAFNFVQNAYK